jgi:hypothetical protein
MSNRKIDASKMVEIVGQIQQRLPPKRRKPSMPRVAFLDNRPTPERSAKAPDGIDTATGTKAQRRNPLEVHRQHFSDHQIAAAAWYLQIREAVDTAAKTTASFSGMPVEQPGERPRQGGVNDKRRADAAELAWIEAKMEPEFLILLDLLVVGVNAERKNQPQTVADVARQFVGYRNDQTATPCGVGMLWGALVRLGGLGIELRAGDRKFSTEEEIARRIQERRRKADTAREQFERETCPKRERQPIKPREQANPKGVRPWREKYGNQDKS